MRAFLALLFCITCSLSARAQDGLTGQDLAYLNKRWGAAHLDGFVGGMTAPERAKLHGLINDPATSEYAGSRDTLVFQDLVAIYGRQCTAWKAEHRAPECPPIANTAVQPGKNVADRSCNSCHLFGTAVAPSFVAMAAENRVTKAGLEASLAGGHQMSPIKLAPSELEALYAYIISLK